MGHSPSRPNAAAADPLPSRFARFRRRLRLHRRSRSRGGGDDDSSSAKAIAADEFAGIARIHIVKFKDKFFACLSLGERTYRTETSDKYTNRFSKNTLVGYCEVDLFEMLTKRLMFFSV
nr:unnamed protein product [Digitaria exilis]